MMLLPCADVAAVHILLDIGTGAGPPVVSVDEFVGPVNARVACGRVVVALLKDLLAEVTVVGHIDPTVVTRVG